MLNNSENICDRLLQSPEWDPKLSRSGICFFSEVALRGYSNPCGDIPTFLQASNPFSKPLSKSRITAVEFHFEIQNNIVFLGQSGIFNLTGVILKPWNFVKSCDDVSANAKRIKMWLTFFPREYYFRLVAYIFFCWVFLCFFFLTTALICLFYICRNVSWMLERPFMGKKHR